MKSGTIPFLIIAVFIAAAIAFSLTGCTAPNLSEKSVLIEGYSAVNLIDTGFNPVTGTVTPSITSIISNGIYCGVPAGIQSKDFLYYSDKASSSVWNAKAQTSQTMLVFSTTDQEKMKAILESLKKAIDSKAEESQKETAPDGETKD